MSASAPPVKHDQSYLEADKCPVILGVIFTVSTLSTIFVADRVYTRKNILGALHLDDWFTIVAVFFEWTQVALSVLAVRSGNGKHFDTLSLTQKQNAILFTILGFPFGVMAFGFPKLAVVALLVRIMNPSRIQQFILWGLASCCMLSLLGCIIILFVQCQPSRAQWDFSIADKTCWSPDVLVDFAIFAGSLSATTDLYLAVYPAVVLWQLQMNIHKKIALSFALGIGSIATVVAIYKCTRLPSLASADFSYLVIWTVIESSTIIIACCVPVLQPLVDLLMGRRAFDSSTGGYKHYNPSGYQNYGNTRSDQHHGDIELSSSRQARSKNATDIENATYLGSHAVELGSQESILQHNSTTAVDLIDHTSMSTG
uniref:Rhodopsin domain-containing protein n=1 Tax=Fusarium oxysporum (strain Fo5176) TaxID=660025 RepID=A0A0C4DJB4_FUSOF